MAWFLLVIAGGLEVVWASLLPHTNPVARPFTTIGFVAALAASMCLLAVATRTIPVGTAYAVWVGIGAVGTVLVAAIGARQAPLPAHALALLALVASIVAVKVTSSH
jgi:quaternary ammonium compound-resistance protein SugE